MTVKDSGFQKPNAHIHHNLLFSSHSPFFLAVSSEQQDKSRTSTKEGCWSSI